MPSGPKSNKYTNRHAAEANQRKQERAETEKQQREKAKEDAMWAVTDKRESRRMDRDQEKSQKEAERARREAEKKEQLRLEEGEASGVPKKVSKREMQKAVARMCTEYDKHLNAVRGSIDTNDDAPSSAPKTVLPSAEEPDEEKDAGPLNWGTEGDSGINDRNIGRRARTLYRSFYQEQLERVKQEQPGLRRTQYHKIIWDLWQKSPTNPFAQRKEKLSQERLEMERRWIQGEVSDEDEKES